MTNEALYSFRNDLGISESSGRYDNDTIYNGLTYWGKYQFGQARLKDICRILNRPFPISRESFTPEVQELFFNTHINDLEKQIYNNNLDRFIGVKIIGKGNNIQTTITLNGLLAGAHIGGFTGMKNFLLFGQDKFDSHTWISDYIAKFSEKEKKKKILKK